MVANSWKMRLDPTSENLVEDWLRDEKVPGYELNVHPEALEIELHDIDSAFRFRMQFDEEILV